LLLSYKKLSYRRDSAPRPPQTIHCQTPCATFLSLIVNLTHLAPKAAYCVKQRVMTVIGPFSLNVIDFNTDRKPCAASY